MAAIVSAISEVQLIIAKGVIANSQLLAAAIAIVSAICEVQLRIAKGVIASCHVSESGLRSVALISLSM